MGIKCLHAGTQHIVGLFDLVYSIQENVIASLHCADLTYPFCNCKIQRKTKQNTRDDVFMPHGQICCDALRLLFAGASLVADALKPFLSVFMIFKCVKEIEFIHPHLSFACFTLCTFGNV